MRSVPLCTLRAENYTTVCAYFISMSAEQCRYRKDTRLIREIQAVIATKQESVVVWRATEAAQHTQCAYCTVRTVQGDTAAPKLQVRMRCTEKTAHCTEMSLVSAATSRPNLHAVDKDYMHKQIRSLSGGQWDECIRPDGVACVTLTDWGAWGKQCLLTG
jgi:hypothetical protein